LYLTLHLLIRCLVIIIFILLFIGRGVFGSFGKVNHLATGTASGRDDVVEVNFLETILIGVSVLFCWSRFVSLFVQ